MLHLFQNIFVLLNVSLHKFAQIISNIIPCDKESASAWAISKYSPIWLKMVEMFVVRDRIKLGLWRGSFVNLVFLDHPNVQNALRMPYDCSSIAARITPEVQLEGASNVQRMQSECSRNGCRIRFERPRIQTNTAGIPGMYFECNWNVTRMSQVYQEYGRNISR